MMEKMFNPPENIWNRLNLIWVVFLIALGFLNLYVAHHYSLEAWVNFKLFGVTSLLFLFMVAQALSLREYFIDAIDATEEKGEK